MQLNTRARSILDLARKYSNEHNISTMGTEFLILAMYDTEDSLCHFLFNEYEINREEIVNKTEDIFILRKREGEYNKSLENILNQASMLANNNVVSEEHLFMSILMNKNTIAISIIVSLGLEVDELIEDVKEIYDFSSSNTDELSFVRNITKMAKNDELASFIKRENYLNKIDIIMNRRYKNNPLLIGNAGVGKTALVEGYAIKLVNEQKDLNILSLNLTAMLAGTRYRGDFEERFNKFVTEIAARKNVVIFIDEIHTIMGAATTEGNLDVANMLKPFLARNDIRVIGATTLEEYHKTIENDKALLRRFQPIFITEPSLEETREILYGIKSDYEKFHNVKIAQAELDYLIEMSDKKIHRRFRPDKCIDILDDCLSYCQIQNRKFVNIEDIDKAILGSIGINESKEGNLYFKDLDKYKWLYDMDLLIKRPLIRIHYEGSIDGLNLLKNDFISMFNFGLESVLEIDLNGYKDSHMLASLVGAPPGYVGYSDEGILCKHILQYPMSLIIFKNFDKAASALKSFIINLLNKGEFTDQRGRYITLNNVMLIVEGIKERYSVGFNNKISEDNLFDDIITYYNTISLNKRYEDALRRFNYEVSFDFDINLENKKSVDNYLFNKLCNNSKGKYIIKKEEIELD